MHSIARQKQSYALVSALLILYKTNLQAVSCWKYVVVADHTAATQCLIVIFVEHDTLPWPRVRHSLCTTNNTRREDVGLERWCSALRCGSWTSRLNCDSWSCWLNCMNNVLLSKRYHVTFALSRRRSVCLCLVCRLCNIVALALYREGLTFRHHRIAQGWLRGAVVERCCLTSELSLSCARSTADGWPLMWVNRPL